MSMRFNPAERRSFIGDSDARVIMGDDETVLLRLWRENAAKPSPRPSLAPLSLVTSRNRPRPREQPPDPIYDFKQREQFRAIRAFARFYSQSPQAAAVAWPHQSTDDQFPA